jgi:hypothetical protein
MLQRAPTVCVCEVSEVLVWVSHHLRRFSFPSSYVAQRWGRIFVPAKGNHVKGIGGLISQHEPNCLKFIFHQSKLGPRLLAWVLNFRALTLKFLMFFWPISALSDLVGRIHFSTKKSIRTWGSNRRILKLHCWTSTSKHYSSSFHGI